jgi:FlaA1/EpsC-like NDP-sugar epimerase
MADREACSLDVALVSNRSIPLSSAVAAGPLALVLMAGARYAWRLRLELRRRPTGADGTRLLVFGAGEGGAQVITVMLRDPDSPYYPVGLLDDDPEKKNLRIMGVVADLAAGADLAVKVLPPVKNLFGRRGGPVLTSVGSPCAVKPLVTRSNCSRIKQACG